MIVESIKSNANNNAENYENHRRIMAWQHFSIRTMPRGDKRLKNLLNLVAKNYEGLDAALIDKQKETLEKFEECMKGMLGITERDAFSYAFRLGLQGASEKE